MITVFGATGTTGAPLVDTLLTKGATVRAVTSNPASLDALKAKGCEAVVASFTDPAALAKNSSVSRSATVLPCHNSVSNKSCIRSLRQSLPAPKRPSILRASFASSELSPSTSWVINVTSTRL